MTNITEEELLKIQSEFKKKPDCIQTMDLFDYRKRIGTYDQIALGQLNASGWLITNEDGSETWISEKQYRKISDLEEWRK